MNPSGQTALISVTDRSSNVLTPRPRLWWSKSFNAALLVSWLAGFAWCGAPVAAPVPDTTSPAAVTPLASSVDLRPEFEKLGLPRWTQGGRPTCSAFTVAGALEFASAKREGKGTRLSVEFLNWASNKECGSTEDGGFFSDLWKGFAAHGICSAAVLPYADKFDPMIQPPKEALDEAKRRLELGLQFHWIKEWNVNTGLTDSHVSGIKQTLASGWPVCSGLRWPKKEQWVEDVLLLCPPEAVRDGHSVLLVGYRDDAAQPGGGVFIFRNTANGGRDGYMPYAYARAYMNDAAWIGFAAAVAGTQEVR